MSLMGTLAKVAIGVAVAKGVGSMIQKAGTAGAGQGGSHGGPRSPGGGRGGLEDTMGDILGGRTARRSGREPGGDGTIGSGSGGGIGGGSGGGIGDFLEELGGHRQGGGATGSARGGGLDDLLGGLGQSQGGGGLGDLLGGLLGGLAGGAASGGGGSFGDILNQSFGNRGEPDIAPTRDQNAMAGLMLKAMIQAAKADGRIDAAEQKKLLGNLGGVPAEERRFVEAEMRAPVDVQGLARQVPRGLEQQVYTMSVMAIDLDNRNEAQYLHQFATALGIDRARVNQIHARLGVPALYA